MGHWNWLSLLEDANILSLQILDLVGSCCMGLWNWLCLLQDPNILSQKILDVAGGCCCIMGYVTGMFWRIPMLCLKMLHIVGVLGGSLVHASVPVFAFVFCLDIMKKKSSVTRA